MIVPPGIAATEWQRVAHALGAVKASISSGLLAVVSLSAPNATMPTTGKPTATTRTIGSTVGRGGNACERQITINGTAEVVDWTGAGLTGKYRDSVEARMIYGAALCDTVAWEPSDLAGVHLSVSNLRSYAQVGDGKQGDLIQMDWTMRMIVRTGDTQEIVT